VGARTEVEVERLRERKSDDAADIVQTKRVSSRSRCNRLFLFPPGAGSAHQPTTYLALCIEAGLVHRVKDEAAELEKREEKEGQRGFDVAFFWICFFPIVFF